MSDMAMGLKKEKTEKKNFEFTRKINGVSKTVRGREVENGWVITIDKSWEEKNPMTGESEWQYNTWEYISARNPLEKIKAEEEAESVEENELTTMLNSIIASQGDLMV